MKYKYTRTFTHDGRRYYVRGQTLEEVGAKLALKKRDVEQQTVAKNNITVADWTRQATALYKTNVSQRTLDDFVSLSERVLIRRYGDMKLSDIKPYHLQEILNEQRGMSSSQVNSVFHVLRFVFSKAYANDLVTRDVSASLTKPTARKKKTRRALTKDERDAVLAVCESDKYLLFALMIYCGCRPDEAASAKGEDVQVIDGFDVLHVRGTKTALSDRFVPLPIDLSCRIKKTRKSEYIAPYDDGTKLDKFRRRRLWRQFVRDVNIHMGCKTYNGEPVPPLLFDDVVPYCLRHEFCTECARRGVDIRVTQRLMGHASIRMTANVYTNLTNSDVLDACRALEKVQQSVQQHDATL